MIRCSLFMAGLCSAVGETRTREPDSLEASSFHRTHSGESPTTKHAAMVSWNHQLATVNRV